MPLASRAAHTLPNFSPLPAKPAEETATFRRARQARGHELWRVAHPFDPAVAVRIICWFPNQEDLVITLAGFDKKGIGTFSTPARQYAAR